jgi:hypothetical protein
MVWAAALASLFLAHRGYGMLRKGEKRLNKSIYNLKQEIEQNSGGSLKRIRRDAPPANVVSDSDESINTENVDIHGGGNVEDIPSFLSDANLVRAVGCYPQQSGERARSQIRTRGDQTKKVIQYLAIPVSIPSGWNGLHGQFEIHVYNIFEGIFWRKDGPNFLAKGWFKRYGSNFEFLVSDANVPHHVDITCSIEDLNDMRTRDVERDEVFDPAPNTHEHVPLSKISKDNLRLGLRDDLIYNIYPAVISDNHQLQTIDEAGWEADNECQFWIDLHRFGIDQDVLTSFPWSLWRKS